MQNLVFPVGLCIYSKLFSKEANETWWHYKLKDREFSVESERKNSSLASWQPSKLKLVFLRRKIHCRNKSIIKILPRAPFSNFELSFRKKYLFPLKTYYTRHCLAAKLYSVVGKIITYPFVSFTKSIYCSSSSPSPL